MHGQDKVMPLTPTARVFTNLRACFLCGDEKCGSSDEAIAWTKDEMASTVVRRS